MSDSEIEMIYKEFVDSGAILNGHFLLSSGLHSDVYIQCALILKNTKKAVSLCNLLYKKVLSNINTNVDIVVSPAMGGIIVGYEIARNFGVDFVFFERVNNKFTLKRNFVIPKNANVLIVEDVITTGASSIEIIKLIEGFGARIVAEAVLVNRSNENPINYPLISLIDVEANYYTKENLPIHLKSIPALRPGTKIVETK